MTATELNLTLNDNLSVSAGSDEDGYVYDYGESYYYADIDKLKKVWLSQPDYIPTVIVYGLAFLVGLAGNCLVITAIVGDLKQRSNTTIFLVSLATSDILFLLVCVPYELSSDYIAHWQLGTFLCKVSCFVEMMTAVLTVLNLTVVSIERYVAIVHPMRSRYLFTIGNLRRVIPLVWVMSAILSAPTFVIWSTDIDFFHNNETSVTMIFCTDHGMDDVYRQWFACYQYIIMFLLPTIIMIFCYIRVINALWVSTKALSLLTPGRSGDTFFLGRIETCSLGPNTPAAPRLLKRAITSHKSKVLASRRQVIKLLLLIIVAFLISWGPKLTMRVFRKFELPFLYHEELYIIKIFIDVLPYIQSCVNPIFYCFMSRNFRRSVRILLARKPVKATTESVRNEFQTQTSTSNGRQQNGTYLKMKQMEE